MVVESVFLSGWTNYEYCLIMDFYNKKKLYLFNSLLAEFLLIEAKHTQVYIVNVF